ncbi:hypothetical protein BJY04DRAFT_218620 [Aspergillus karnatakaensis]|uniref:uncharacterized protein n=1 Tax=Aspergillus karnatakaensis TaxID=1810916 RepID=UPI003CCD4945
MEFLIREGASTRALSSPDYRGLLSFTVSKNDIEGTKLLLRHKALLNYRGPLWGRGDLYQNSPLGLAIPENRVEIAKLLFDADGDEETLIDSLDGVADAAQLLAKREDTAMLRLLLRHERRFWLQRERYREQMRREFVEEDGMVFARVMQEPGQPRHPLTIAIQADNVAAARLFLEAGARLDDMRRGVVLAKSDGMRALLQANQ